MSERNPASASTRAWRVAVAVLAAPGIAWTFTSAQRNGWMALGLCAVLVAGWVAVVSGSPDPSVGVRVRHAAPRALAVGVGVLGAVGWMLALQGAGSCVVVAVALTSPPVVRRVAALARRAEELRVLDARGAEGALDTLSTTELVTLWHRSGRAVAEALVERDVDSAVTARAAYLDELERRHPERFRLWIDSGDPLTTDPAHYLLPPGRASSGG